MRMWMIPASLLCRQHLLGEHSEIHKHRHNFVKGHKMNGRRGQIDPCNMQSRHDELVVEMLQRGYKHESPYAQPDLSAYDFDDWHVDPSESLNELKRRCLDCRKRIDSA
jgi:hypothetical protein